MWHAVYFTLTLVVEAGIIQSLIHRARQAIKHKRGYGWLGGHLFSAVPTGSSSHGDVEAAGQPWEGEGEDEDVREERLIVDSGTLSLPELIADWSRAQTVYLWQNHLHAAVSGYIV